MGLIFFICILLGVKDSSISELMSSVNWGKFSISIPSNIVLPHTIFPFFVTLHLYMPTSFRNVRVSYITWIRQETKVVQSCVSGFVRAGKLHSTSGELTESLGCSLGPSSLASIGFQFYLSSDDSTEAST
jgi:hypothetical protein